MLTQERIKEILDYDPMTGEFVWKVERSGYVKKGKKAGSRHRTGYITITVDNIAYKAHRLAWLYVYGELPNSPLDHINGDRKDNRISNIRQTSNNENQWNRYKARRDNACTELLGVSWHKARGKWRVHISVDKKNLYLGSYPTAEEGYAIYLRFKELLHTIGDKEAGRALAVKMRTEEGRKLVEELKKCK